MTKGLLLTILTVLLFSTFSTGCFFRRRGRRRCYTNRRGVRVCKTRRHGKRHHKHKKVRRRRK